MKRSAALLLVLAGCATAPAPTAARLHVRYYDARGALLESHELRPDIEKRFAEDVSGVQYRFTLHQDYTVSL